MSNVIQKQAKIVSRPNLISDDGRAIGNLDWQLFLNDNAGFGFWHGGPGYKNHGRSFNSEEAAKQFATDNGYTLLGTSWT